MKDWTVKRRTILGWYLAGRLDAVSIQAHMSLHQLYASLRNAIAAEKAGEYGRGFAVAGGVNVPCCS
jgi:hypothetical protein